METNADPKHWFLKVLINRAVENTYGEFASTSTESDGCFGSAFKANADPYLLFFRVQKVAFWYPSLKKAEFP
jgi:hypothetical protein